MNFFKSKHRTPADLVRQLRDSVGRMDTANGSSESKRKASEDVSKNLGYVKTLLYGDGENEPLPDQVAQLAQEVYNQDVLQLLVLNIWRFEFEVRS